MVLVVVPSWVGVVDIIVDVVVLVVSVSNMLLLFECLPKNLHLQKVLKLLLLYMYLDTLFHNLLNFSICLSLILLCLDSLILLMSKLNCVRFFS